MLKKKYGNKAKLLLTDADSLTYEMETENVFDAVMENKILFHFSKYSKDPKFHDKTKNLVNWQKEQWHKLCTNC